MGGIAEYVDNEDRNPSKLPKLLGLTGIASGADSPWMQRQEFDDEVPYMMDIFALVSEFGISERSAIRAVKVKHRLGKSPSTIKRHMANQLGELFIRTMKTARNHAPLGRLNEADRTKFFTSFPPEAMTIIRKASSR